MLVMVTVGKIASKTSNTVWELTANGYFTRNGSAPLNVIAATATRADFYEGFTRYI